MAEIFEEANKNLLAGAEEDPEELEVQHVSDIAKIGKNDPLGNDNYNYSGLPEIPQPVASEIKSRHASKKRTDALQAQVKHKKFSPHIDQVSCESEVILFVDNREKRNASDINYFYERFMASGLKTELRSLPLGDFLWVLRVKNDQLIQMEQEDIEEVANPNPDD